jgi:ABC-2 type transport system ATP-binding protein
MLELSGLRKRYGSTVALDACSFSVERGRVMGFLGRNGAGKTTAMRSIFGLVQLDAGAIRWEGGPADREARMRFGYMPEERGLYQRMTAHDQLQYFGRLRGLDPQAAAAESERWLHRLDLVERRDSRVDSLSHGNQQKVQLGVALVGDPQLLVLDEPFSGLDPIAVGVLSSVIREAANNGAAVVFSSHQLELVGDVCDDIAVITHGRVVLTGDLGEVRRKSPARELWLRLDEPMDGAWAPMLAERLNATLLSDGDDFARLTVPASARPAEILGVLGDAASRVVEFQLEPPDLEDIFREAVGESAHPDPLPRGPREQ